MKGLKSDNSHYPEQIARILCKVTQSFQNNSLNKLYYLQIFFSIYEFNTKYVFCLPDKISLPRKANKELHTEV